MKLHYLYYPNPKNEETILILHGLFGSSKNWISISKKLSQNFNVYALDLRNHGNSPHSQTHSLNDMISDVEEFILQKSIQNPILLGHSMGGLVAMGIALKNFIELKKLIVVDISPKVYSPHHQREFEVLKTDVSQFSTREEINVFLKNIHPDDSVRQFLMMNLVKSDKGYQWKINVNALEKGNYLEEVQNWTDKSSDVPTLFIRAKDSNYILDSDYDLIYKHFPKGIIKELNGNHWVHYANEKEFIQTVLNFINHTNSL
ncbi:MAG: alpha/beta fold hydrolase [Leptonema sp. (in: bacteria)]